MGHLKQLSILCMSSLVVSACASQGSPGLRNPASDREVTTQHWESLTPEAQEKNRAAVKAFQERLQSFRDKRVTVICSCRSLLTRDAKIGDGLGAIGFVDTARRVAGPQNPEDYEMAACNIPHEDGGSTFCYDFIPIR